MGDKTACVISEAPCLTTGFGCTTKQICEALVTSGWRVACFGIGLLGETFDRTTFPYRIWAAGSEQHTDLSLFSEFLRFENPALLVVNYDFVSVRRWLQVLRALHWKGPTIVHGVADGLPLLRSEIEPLRDVAVCITPTQCVGNFLREAEVANIVVAPHGVDASIFRPLEHHTRTRRDCGLEETFLVGHFGRNCARKQQVKSLLALQKLKNIGHRNICLYLHCDWLSRDPDGWNLLEIAGNLRVLDSVLFKNHGRLRCQDDTQASAFRKVDYEARIEMCDVIINPSFSGGFELTLIEAQSCGVPVIATDDCGSMREVAGLGAILLPAADVGIWKNGGKQHFVSRDLLADSILTLWQDPGLRRQYIELGFENSARYPWSHLREAVVSASEKAIRL
jgi:glycosyltransferase involved in cell wall biosynthesis